MEYYRKNIITIAGVVLATVTSVVLFLAGKNGSNMVEFYCSPGSLFLGLYLSKWIYCGGTVIITHILLGSAFFMGVFFLIARISDARKKKEKSDGAKTIFNVFDLKKLYLAKGGFINYPESKFHNVSVEEYTFTVINETGQDLKKCFVLLDEVWIKNDYQTKGIWKLETKDIFDKPFRWAKTDLPIDGKIDIDNNNKASFVLVELIRSSALNVAENRNEPYLDFGLALVGAGESSHALNVGWDYRLVFSIRARDKDNRDFSVRYSIYLHPHSEKGVIDIKLVRERQKQGILKSAT